MGEKNTGGKGLNTIIGKGSTVEGTLNINNCLRIDGTVKGKISCTETLTISSDGVVEAEINAKDAVFSGKVVGNVKVSGKVELDNNASVHGDITTSQIIINEGAFFQGNCNMKNNEQKK